MSKYTLLARFFPTLLCSIPFIIFQYFFLSTEILAFLNYLGGIKLVGNVTFTAIFIYFLSQVNRFLGKELFEKRYFCDESYMPTTNFLLFSNGQYSNDYKTKIHEKIKKDFNISLCTEDEELKNETTARKKIVEAISLIRRRLGNGQLLLQHNIEYGFVRNFIGGSIIGLVFSITNTFLAYWYHANAVLLISCAQGIIYFLAILLSKSLISRMGVLYAKILIQEYVSMK